MVVSGDTRFDRVAAILEKDNDLDYISQFKNNTLTIVVGSSWPKDEALLLDFINSNTLNVKFIIAPHNIKADQIEQLKNSITKKTVLFSEMQEKNLEDFDVFIIDTIGILTKIYSYAAKQFKKALQDRQLTQIEDYQGKRFVEGKEYGLEYPIVSYTDFGFKDLIVDDSFRSEKGHICSTFVQMNKGATNLIMKNIAK